MILGNSQYAMADEYSRYHTFISKVFLYLFANLALTGIIAAAMMYSGATAFLIKYPVLYFVLLFAPLGYIWWFGRELHEIKPETASLTFFMYGLCEGLTLSVLLIQYTSASIWVALGMTMGTCLLMAIVARSGLVDLRGKGDFFLLALIGLLFAMIINLFVGSSTFDTVICVVGIVLFSALVVYDLQRLQLDYEMAGKAEASQHNKALYCAIGLYLDFLNLFLFFLRLFGHRND